MAPSVCAAAGELKTHTEQRLLWQPVGIVNTQTVNFPIVG